MGSHVSNAGAWVAAKEKVSLVNNSNKSIKHPITGEMIGPGEPYIYEGPCRSAQEQYSNGDITSQPFWKDTEFINRVRQVHNMSMEEYMKANGFDEKTSKEEFEKKLKVVNLHRAEPRKPAKRQRSGGANTAPGGAGSLEGDFGDLQDAKSKVK